MRQDLIDYRIQIFGSTTVIGDQLPIYFTTCKSDNSLRLWNSHSHAIDAQWLECTWKNYSPLTHDKESLFYHFHFQENRCPRNLHLRFQFFSVQMAGA